MLLAAVSDNILLRQTDENAICGQGGQPGFEGGAVGTEGMVRRRHDRPVRRRGGGLWRVPRQVAEDQLDGEGAHPGVDSGRRRGRLCGCVGVRRREPRLVLQGRGHLGDGRLGEVGGRGGRTQSETAGGFADELAHGDRIEVQIGEEAAVLPHRGRGQLGPLGDQAADDVEGGGAVRGMNRSNRVILRASLASRKDLGGRTFPSPRSFGSPRLPAG